MSKPGSALTSTRQRDETETYRDEVLDDVHVGQRVNLERGVVGRDRGQAGERVAALNVHRARAANACSKKKKLGA